MNRSPLAVWTPTTSFAARVTPKQGICLHHVAGVVDNCLNVFNTRKVSTQYSVGVSGLIRQYVDEDYVSWATGTKLGNENFINIEVSNCGGAPNWPVASVSITKCVELVADIAKRNGFYPLVAEVNLRQHKQFVATYCAGRVGEALVEIATRANELIGENGNTTQVVPPAGELSYPLACRGSTGDYVKVIQKAVGIVADGIFGINTYSAVKAFQKDNNLVIDGIVGPATWKAILGSTSAKDNGKEVEGYKDMPVLRIGSRQPEVMIVQKAVDVSVDGIFGPLTSAAVKLLQKKRGLVVDGIVGPKTWKALWLS